MLNRREFLQWTGAASMAGLWAGPALAQPEKRLRLAVVTTEWRYHSHAWHMAERFLVGYPKQGKWHRPPLDVVSAYVDQFPEKDLARSRSAEFKFPIYPSVAEALRCGGDRLAVDAVLIIGEHGSYPRSEFHQTKYPRYELFKAVTDVFRKDGRSVPVFNDKHLSWKWSWAKEMVDISKELNFAFTAGSSLPVTYRMPDVELPYGAEVEEVLGVSIGSVDSYDFHCLEMMQCLVERRKGEKPAWSPCRRCAVRQSGRRWRGRRGGRGAGIPSCLKRVSRARRLWRSPRHSAIAIPPPPRFANG